EHEDELEGGVPGREVEAGDAAEARDPAGEGGEEEEREQEAGHEERRRREHIVDDTPGNRERNRPEVSGHVLVNLLRMAQTEAVIESTAISNAHPNPSTSACGFQP